GFVKQGAHLPNLAVAALTGSQFEQHRLLLALARQPVTRALGRSGFSSAYIAGKNHERVTLGYSGADGQILVMKFLRPISQFLGIGKQAQIAVEPAVAG